MSILDDLKSEYRLGGWPQKLIFWNVGLFAVGLLLELIFREQYFQWLSYVAVTETGPEVEFGMDGVEEQASFHVIVGQW